ncbi:unnamed protein product [Microthlaspi erraticum]|uniref:KIB1-4 beta-propeller domain-containing protein n=1 Tax=Microthlaspi erraticum TaxID=1685480 RepID=A0A6D2IJ47_9BRAS|nr:unnamed protein product [Microthlaspi erraticum]
MRPLSRKLHFGTQQNPKILNYSPTNLTPPSPSQTPPLSPTMASRSPSPITFRRRRPQHWSKVDPSFADLPSSLLEVIMSRIVLEDNIRASAACKSWHEAATYVRVVENHPWLLSFPKRGGSDLLELRDPLQSKSFTMKVPWSPYDDTVCYTRDGWLLVRSRSYSSSDPDKIFFFNPFSQERISLPKLHFIRCHELAFSCPPTSDDCVLLASCCDQRDNVTLITWRPGETKWTITTGDFGSSEKYGMLLYSKSNDRFYFLTSRSLQSFHPSSGTWKRDSLTGIYVHNDSQRQRYGHHELNSKKIYFAEKRGEVFLMVTWGKKKPRVFGMEGDE